MENEQKKKRNPSKKQILNQIKNVSKDERIAKIKESDPDISHPRTRKKHYTLDELAVLIAENDDLYACFHYIYVFHGKKPGINSESVDNPTIQLSFHYSMGNKYDGMKQKDYDHLDKIRGHKWIRFSDPSVTTIDPRLPMEEIMEYYGMEDFSNAKVIS